MTASQNGWRANDRSVITTIQVPGGSLSVHNGDIAVIFQHLANRFHNEVEHLVWPGNWGYAERDVRGSTDISNHASGTAVDFNAPKHPLATDPHANYTQQQINAIHNIVNYYEGVIRWGGDYNGRKDGMHFEINDGITEAQVARIAAKIHGEVAQPLPAPAPAPAPAPQGDPNDLPTLAYGQTSEAVKALQRFLNAYNWRPVLPLLPVTGYYGDQTATVLHRAGGQCGIQGDADGRNFGPKFKAAFWQRGFRG